MLAARAECTCRRRGEQQLLQQQASHLAQASRAAGISEGGTPNSSVTATMAWPSGVSRCPTAAARQAGKQGVTPHTNSTGFDRGLALAWPPPLQCQQQSSSSDPLQAVLCTACPSAPTPLHPPVSLM